MSPFRDLVQSSTPFYWDENLSTAFTSSKHHILAMVKDGVRSFDVDRPTCLVTDWSRNGLGFLMQQQYCFCPLASIPNCCHEGWKLVFAGSRLTTPIESCYALIEGKVLAVTDALDRCCMFVIGCPTPILVVDHCPFLAILNSRSCPLNVFFAIFVGTCNGHEG